MVFLGNKWEKLVIKRIHSVMPLICSAFHMTLPGTADPDGIKNPRTARKNDFFIKQEASPEQFHMPDLNKGLIFLIRTSWKEQKAGHLVN